MDPPPPSLGAEFVGELPPVALGARLGSPPIMLPPPCQNTKQKKDYYHKIRYHYQKGKSQAIFLLFFILMEKIIESALMTEIHQIKHNSNTYRAEINRYHRFENQFK